MFSPGNGLLQLQLSRQSYPERIYSQDEVRQPCFISNVVNLSWYKTTYPSPDSMVHGTNMGPTWVLSAPDGPHVGPMNLAVREENRDHWNKRNVKQCFLPPAVLHNIILPRSPTDIMRLGRVQITVTTYILNVNAYHTLLNFDGGIT